MVLNKTAQMLMIATFSAAEPSALPMEWSQSGLGIEFRAIRSPT